ncbi:MAG: DUF3037 domain-containing protein [Anaerolineae bacterium]
MNEPQMAHFTYATVQYAHDPVTAECINVGLVLLAPEQRLFLSNVHTSTTRATASFADLDAPRLRDYLKRLSTRLKHIEREVASPQLLLLVQEPIEPSIEGVLRQVTGAGDESIRLGPIHGGIAHDPKAAFAHLYHRLVLSHLPEAHKGGRNNDEVWSVFRQPLAECNIADRLHSAVVDAQVDTFEFKASWRNGALNLLQPFSLDLILPGSIRGKARDWLGTTMLLPRSQERIGHIYLLVGNATHADELIQRAYSDSIEILRASTKADLPVTVVEEHEASEFAKLIALKIREDLDGHEES